MTLIATLYALVPMVIALFGGAIASYYTLKGTHASLLQHFVAGVLIAAVATELLPKIISNDEPLRTALGFCIGVMFMVILHEVAHRLSHKEGKKFPLRLIGASAIDFFIDGLLIGIAFLAGRSSGILIAFSLIPCAFVLALSVSSILKKQSFSTGFQLLCIFCISLMLPIGAFIGSNVVEHLPPSVLNQTLAGGVAALLYLAIEEFMVEAHRVKENRYVSLSLSFSVF